MRHLVLGGALLAVLAVPAGARGQSAAEDAYTRYELLAPETSSFRIVYDVTATTAGARFFFNPIRRGSEATDIAVLDRATGLPLRFEVVPGAEAAREGQRGATPEDTFIKVHLARPVPEGGEARLRIAKTYKDPKSYFAQGDAIVFDRALGIPRNAVVLPAGYEILSCNVPSQVLEESDGRVLISFMHAAPGAAALVLRGRKLPPREAKPAQGAAPPAPSASQAPGVPVAATPAPAGRSEIENLRVSERATQDREIVYFLQPPETHAFSLYHDYTESRPGIGTYLNIVRAGSRVSNPSARLLDTGEALHTEILRGEAITKAGLEVEDVTPATEVVVVRFRPAGKGQSVRLRIEETYTDPSRYGLEAGQLVWHRSFGRPANDLVLPAGWYLTASSIPAVVREEPDGRIRLGFLNPRPDSIDVVVKARKR